MKRMNAASSVIAPQMMLIFCRITFARSSAQGMCSRAMRHIGLLHALTANRLPAMGIGATRTKNVHQSHARHPAVKDFLKKLSGAMSRGVMRNA